MSEAHAQGTYNIPSGYDDNRIVLLARDPNWLYAYWEISSATKSNFIREFNQDLWEKSVPVLKVTNVSKNASFNIRINDFSNSWYINVEDSNSLYTAELGRVVSEQFFINLASSNYVVTPGNAVSSNTTAYFLDYRNLRNGKFDPESGKIYENYGYDLHSRGVIGISSPELMGMDLEESMFGISSGLLSGISSTW